MHRGVLQSWLTHRRLPLYLALLGFVLGIPSLWVGIQLDDYVHRMVLVDAMVDGGFSSHVANLFVFMDGDPDRTLRMMDIGILPWWTLQEVQGAFWRPLSALTHWLDYQLWPDLPVLMHTQSLLWYAALVVVITLFYRGVMGVSWVAGLAALLFAVEDAHGFPVGWLANRNALLATFFGVLSLLAHDRWRRSGVAARQAARSVISAVGVALG